MTTSGLIQREQDFYDQRWEHCELGQNELARIAFTLASVPPDCRRVLDMGCGDGRVSHEVSKKPGCFLVAFDLSTVALNHLSVPKCCGSAEQLPFPDRSFDLVMATEILEHLPVALYQQVISELARVADKHILVTVPNSENLEEHTAVCGTCGSRFHVWGHQRFYTPDMLPRLFTGFNLTQLTPFGSSVETYNKYLLWLRRRVAGAWYWEDRTVCYFCQAKAQPSPRWVFLARLCDFLNARLWAPFSKRRSWLLGLYAREAR